LPEWKWDFYLPENLYNDTGDLVVDTLPVKDNRPKTSDSKCSQVGQIEPTKMERDAIS
jgi:hypothetical protein